MITIKAIKDAWHVLFNHDEYVEEKSTYNNLMYSAYERRLDLGFNNEGVEIRTFIPKFKLDLYLKRRNITINKTTD